MNGAVGRVAGGWNLKFIARWRIWLDEQQMLPAVPGPRFATILSLYHSFEDGFKLPGIALSKTKCLLVKHYPDFDLQTGESSPAHRLEVVNAAGKR